MTADLLRVEALSHSYALACERLWRTPQRLHALHDVNLQLRTGRSLGVVGESGSGKSTLARLIMALERPSAGRVLMQGQDLNHLSSTALRQARRDFQMVFQDPYGSLDPRQTVVRIVCEPLEAQPEVPRSQRRELALATLAAVGLHDGDLDKYPHEFSGGQRQRIAIARALITRPRLIVADEPVSALDVSVQAQVLNLMQDVQDQFGVSYVLISHNLAVINHLCDEVAVIYLGRIVEQGTPHHLFRHAAHPYTRALVAAIARIEPGGPRPPNTHASANKPHSAAPVSPGACPYAPRCDHARALCTQSRPELLRIAPEHWVACHFGASLVATD